MRMVLILFTLALLLNGCAVTRYVDAKGRDCKRHSVLGKTAIAFVWDECDEETGSLPAIKIEQDIKIESKEEIKREEKLP